MERKKITAVDVVIIPRGGRAIEEVAETSFLNQCIRWNRQIDGSSIRLRDDDYLPHISLGMGYVDDFEKIKENIASISNTQHPFRVIVDGFIKRDLGNGDAKFFLNVKKTPEVLEVHERIMNSIDWVENKIPSGESFVVCDGEIITDDTFISTQNFRENSSFSQYWPHITLGMGNFSLKSYFPVGFQAESLDLYQLGNFNTCRKFLGSWPLLRE